MLAEEFEQKVIEKFEDLYTFEIESKYYIETSEEYQKYVSFLKENEVEFVQELDEDISSSYDWTDNLIKRLYKHVPTGNFFMLEGREQSYSGTYFTGFRDVEQKQKTIFVYE